MESKKTPIITPLISLAERVPLQTPLGIAISIGNVCDFRCRYCDFANLSAEQKKENQYIPHQMSIEEFDMFAEQLKEFEEPIKQLTFVSHGETLLNHNLPDMIRRIKQDKTATTIKVTTNANKLTKEMSDELIDAGLDQIKISIQGLTEKKYYEVCRTKININKFIEQIRYFYIHRKQCKVYIKILDIALDKNEEELFYKMYGNISDNIFVEQCFGDMAKSSESNKLGMYLGDMNICPMPFYTFPVDVSGNILLCCRLSQTVNGNNAVIGNIYEKSLKTIWDNEFYQLQKKLLEKNLEEGHICNGCTMFHSFAKQDDILDNQLPQIIKRYLRRI